MKNPEEPQLRTKKRISSDSDIFWVLEKAVIIQK
jgi:hypothetical protein